MEFNKSELKAKAYAAAQAALYRAGEKVANESLMVVPRDTGKLTRSQYVSVSDKDSISATVGYKAEYATTVHEGDGTGAKFLEAPFNALKSECLGIIKSGIEEAIK